MRLQENGGCWMEYNLLMSSSINHVEILQAALVGLQHQASEVDRKMAEIRAWIGGSQRSSAPESSGPAGKRVLSAAVRRRMAAAQRKRWAAYRKDEKTSVSAQKPALAKPAGRKRTLSPAGKKRIAEANQKRWAAFRAAKATPAKKAAAAKKTVQTKNSPAANKSRKPVARKSIAPQAARAAALPVEQTTTA
jgi:uncharacterized protein RhaS with RHS repeats